MPYINKPIRKKPNTKLNRLNFNNKYNKFYQHSREVRNEYFNTHQLCELSLVEGKYVPAEHVHHLYEITRGHTDEERDYIASLYENLISLSKDMHYNVHNHPNRLTDKQKLYLAHRLDIVHKILNIK